MSKATQTHTDYVYQKAPNPHWVRKREIMSKHPEVKKLFGYTPTTALFTIVLVGIQLAIAYAMGFAPWWLLLILAYFIGGTVNHALFVVVHEATHNLVFKYPWQNRLLGLFTNFPQFFPSSMQFFKYHMLHHTHQSEFDFDADLAGHREADWIANSRLKKGLAMFFFGFVQGTIRPSRLKKVSFWDGWFVINLFTQLTFLLIFFYFTSWQALLYLFLSTIFALGLHPMGGRWIQEHYLVKEDQETNSYYGPLNKLCFNMGYHNEHHDFMKVPWSRLPKLRQIAPEFYNQLFYYQSWSWCLWRFIFDQRASFYDRIVREGQKG